MINRSHRFHGHNSLRYVYQHGKTVRGGLFAIRSAHNTRRRVYRAAIVVSKKVSKSAVVRNRIRRRLYEQLRSHEAYINQPYDIVVNVFSASVADVPADELRQQVAHMLQQAQIVTPVAKTGQRGIIEEKES